MRTETITITPDIAAQWLAGNTNNRPMNRKHIAALVEQMASGQWQKNGESIKIASDGALLDGQHRLAACIKSGVPFTSLVVTDLDGATFATMDTGMARGASDVLAIAGEASTSKLASGIRAAILLENGSFHLAHKVTNTQVLDYLAQEPGIRAFASPNKNLSMLCGAAVFCGLRYVTFKYHPEQSTLFFEGLETGVGLRERSAIKVLRDRLIYQRGATTKLLARDVMALAIKAWNAHVQYKAVGTLRWDSAREDFPQIL